MCVWLLQYVVRDGYSAPQYDNALHSSIRHTCSCMHACTHRHAHTHPYSAELLCACCTFGDGGTLLTQMIDGAIWCKRGKGRLGTRASVLPGIFRLGAIGEYNAFQQKQHWVALAKPYQKWHLLAAPAQWRRTSLNPWPCAVLCCVGIATLGMLPVARLPQQRPSHPQIGGANGRSARHSLREGPLVLGAAPTAWEGAADPEYASASSGLALVYPHGWASCSHAGGLATLCC